MAETRAHVATLTSSYDALKGAHDALNQAAQQALAEKDQQIQESIAIAPGMVPHWLQMARTWISCTGTL